MSKNLFFKIDSGSIRGYGGLSWTTGDPIKPGKSLKKTPKHLKKPWGPGGGWGSLEAQ